MNNSRAIRRPGAPRIGTTTSGASSGGKRKWIVGIVAVLLMAAAAWAFMPAGPDPALARIQELRDQMEDAPREKRRELWDQMRDEYRKLPEEARERLSDERRQRWGEREQRFLNEFFAMTPAEQVAKIDEQLKEEEERRQRWAQRRAQRGDDARRGGDRRGRGRMRGSRDSLERRKGYLDRTSPQTRAQRGEYYRMRAARRKALGIPPRRRR